MFLVEHPIGGVLVIETFLAFISSITMSSIEWKLALSIIKKQYSLSLLILEHNLCKKALNVVEFIGSSEIWNKKTLLYVVGMLRTAPLRSAILSSSCSLSSHSDLLPPCSLRFASFTGRRTLAPSPMVSQYLLKNLFYADDILFFNVKQWI